VDRLVALDAPEAPLAEVKELATPQERERQRQEAEADAADFRAVAPAVTSFASGRRR
jgi:hypothetical protein